jgi:hypothetical protein
VLLRKRACWNLHSCSRNRLTVYAKNGTAPVPSSTSATATGPTPTPSTAATGIPASWKYNGCYTEGTTGRALKNQRPDSATLTVESCIQTCISLGYSAAGMEYGQQCFCDNFLYNGATLVADTQCSMTCPGNPNEKCGAGDRLSVYNTGNLTVYQAPTAQKTNLPGSWVYQGCYNDNVGGVRAMMWQTILTTNNTATSCLGLCAKFGYGAGGMQYGDECFCGDDETVIASGSTIQPEVRY